MSTYDSGKRATTALFLIPLQPNAPSPTSTIITHIARRYSAHALPPYYLDHRMFIDTSSLIPNTDPSTRRYTHILTTSHSPSQTFIGTSTTTTPTNPPATSKSDPTSSDPPLSVITIPQSQADGFTSLLTTKLQPHWSFRQHLTLSADQSASLTLSPELPWTVRIGDLRTSTRSPTGGGILRGVLIEVVCTDPAIGGAFLKAGEDEQEGQGEEVKVDQKGQEDVEKFMRGFLEGLVRGSGVDLNGMRMVVGRSRTRTAVEHPNGVEKNGAEKQEQQKVEEPDWELSKLYMQLLKTTRP